jgi:hypothetical protein
LRVGPISGFGDEIGVILELFQGCFDLLVGHILTSMRSSDIKSQSGHQIYFDIMDVIC